MNIRRYHSKDKDAVLELLRLNTPSFFAPSEEREFVEYLKKDSHNYFVVVHSGKCIGAGGFNKGFDGGKTARISWGIIHPIWHGKGVGRELTQFRIEQIKKNDEVEKIIVRTTQIVHGFYSKMGFELENMEKDYWAPGFDLYQMKMKINNNLETFEK